MLKINQFELVDAENPLTGVEEIYLILDYNEDGEDKKYIFSIGDQDKWRLLFAAMMEIVRENPDVFKENKEN